MQWDLHEAIAYYRKMGAPSDQSAVVGLLREVQENTNGSIPADLLPVIAAGLGSKEALLTALIRRIPSLKLGSTRVLELCAGPNCGKHRELAAFAEKICAQKGVTLKYMPCMRLCGKGPNLRWNGQLHHRAEETLIRRLLEE